MVPFTMRLTGSAVQQNLAQLRARAARALSIARCLAPGPSERAGLDEQLGLLLLDQVGRVQPSGQSWLQGCP